MSSDTSRREPLRSAQVLDLGSLTMRSERGGNVHSIGLSGELDLLTAEEVEEELKRVERTDADKIILDLSGLTFIDSTGVKLVFAAEARSRADSNRLRLIRGTPSVQRVFALCGLEARLPFAD